jgi:hypothetical protein
VYAVDLPPDRVHAHYMSGVQERSVEAERLYLLASEKFNLAMRVRVCVLVCTHTERVHICPRLLHPALSRSFG